MDKFKISIICTFVIIFLIPSANFAINAPTLLTGKPENDNSILLTWRNNDLAADEIIVYRKRESEQWEAIDTIPANPARYSDSSLNPSTQYAYYLISKAEDGVSASSNILSTVTLEKIIRMGAAGIEGVWSREDKTITIGFVDMANSEFGFRLWRRNVPGDWVCVDSLHSPNPIEMGGKLQFSDKSVIVNSWYIYRVEVYNDTLSSAAGKDTLYTYDYPDRDSGYVIKKLGTHPINPAGWIEKVGDSLYILESLPQGGTGIAVIDVSDDTNPSFANYLDTNNLAEHFKGTVLWPRIKLGVSEGEIVYARGHYIYCKNRLLILRDSATHDIADTLSFPTDPPSLRSNVKVQMGKKITATEFFLLIGNIGFFENRYWLFRVKIGLQSIELSPPIATGNEYSGAVNSSFHYAGSYGSKSIIANHVSGMGRNYSNCSIYDTMAGADSVLRHEVRDGSCPVAVARLPNSKIGFAHDYNGDDWTIYAFDLSDSRSGPSFNLGAYTSVKDGKNSQFRKAFVEPDKNRLYVFSNTSFSIYSYESADLAIDVIKKSAVINPLLSASKWAGGAIQFTVNPGNRVPVRLLICNLNGKIISQLAFKNRKTVVWNNPEKSSGRVSMGTYVAIVHFEDELKPVTVLFRN